MQDSPIPVTIETDQLTTRASVYTGSTDIPPYVAEQPQQPRTPPQQRVAQQQQRVTQQQQQQQQQVQQQSNKPRVNFSHEHWVDKEIFP